MRLTILRLLIILPMLFITHVGAQIAPEGEPEGELGGETYRVGLMVEEVQQALNSRDEQALQTIRLYGTDSRYYSMIRGWLFQELVSVESQLHASKDKRMSNQFQRHSNFLKKAIRRVDLE